MNADEFPAFVDFLTAPAPKKFLGHDLSKEPEPSPFCPECADKWMKQLWKGSCVCTGHASLNFSLPT